MLDWTDRGRSVFAFAVVLTLFATVAVTVRCISRGHLLHVFGPSDCFLLVTLLFSLLHTTAIGVHAANGLGLPPYSLTSDERVFFFKLVYYTTVVVNISLVLTKISVLLLLLEIFLTGWPRKATYVLIALVSLYGAWVTFSSIFICIPISSFWVLDRTNRRCIAGTPKWYTDAALNLALDLAIFCLPLPVVWPLTLPWEKKIWLYFVFASGLFVCIASAVRLGFLVSVPGGPKSGIGLVYWLVAEINICIVIACIPTLHPLLLKLRSLLRRSDPELSCPPSDSISISRLRAPDTRDSDRASYPSRGG